MKLFSKFIFILILFINYAQANAIGIYSEVISVADSETQQEGDKKKDGKKKDGKKTEGSDEEEPDCD